MEILTRRVKATFTVDGKEVASVIGKSEEELSSKISTIGMQIKPSEGSKGNVVYEAQRSFLGIVLKKEDLGDNSKRGIDKAWDFLNNVS